MSQGLRVQRGAASQTVDAPSVDEKPRPLRSGLRWVEVVAVIALAFVLRPGPRHARPTLFSSYTPGHAALLAAVGDRFPFEVRVSGSGGQQPIGRTVPGSAGKEVFLAFGGLDLRPMLAAEAEIERRLRQDPTSRAQAAAGVRDLVDGRLDRAIALLESAHLQDPDHPGILNDLAAANFVRGQRGGHPLALLRALSLVMDAGRRAPEQLEPRFNLALILEAVGLRDAARVAWDEYLRASQREDRWTNIAQVQLRRLREPTPRVRWEGLREQFSEAAQAGDQQTLRAIVTDFPQQSVEEAEAWLLSAWPKAVADHDRENARAILEAARGVAAVLRPEAGGRFALAAVEEADEAEQGAESLTLAEAYSGLAEARVKLDHFDGNAAAASLASPVQLLSDHRSPWFPRALYLSALCRYDEGRYDEARSLLERALRGARTVSDSTTILRSRQVLGLIDTIANRFGAGLEDYGLANRLAMSLGWSGEQALTEGLMGEAYSYLGADEEAWRHRLRALEGLGWVSLARLRARVWSEATDAVLASDSPDVAQYFADELVRAARQASDPLPWIVALRKRSSIRLVQGRQEEALADLDAADEWVDQLPDPKLIEIERGDLLIARGELLAVKQPSEALRLLQAATAVAHQTHNDAALPSLLRARSRSERELGDLDAAEVSLEEARREGERVVRSTSVPTDRASALQEMRPIYDELVELKSLRGRPMEALTAAEEARRMSRPRSQETSSASSILQARIPPETAVVAYYQLTDRLLAWVVRRDLTRAVTIPLGRGRASECVAALHAAFAGRAGAESAGEVLYRLLLAPLTPALEGIPRLIIVADGPLSAVPFSALRNPETGRFVVQDHAVAVSPSISAAVGALSVPWQERFEANARVLAAADPYTPYLQDVESLTQAKVEVQRIAARFPRTTILLGRQATEGTFLREAPHYEILHLAAHVLNNQRKPLLSSIALASGSGEDGRLFTYETHRTRLDDVRLAVLAGCKSGENGGDELGLASAFLAAGVQTVIASLWDVEDRSSARFFNSFYEELANTGPVEALRAVQLQSLSSSDEYLSSPAAWGIFEAVVGHP